MKNLVSGLNGQDGRVSKIIPWMFSILYPGLAISFLSLGSSEVKQVSIRIKSSGYFLYKDKAQFPYEESDDLTCQSNAPDD